MQESGISAEERAASSSDPVGAATDATATARGALDNARRPHSLAGWASWRWLATCVALVVMLAQAAPASALDDDPSDDPIARARYTEIGKLIAQKRHEDARAIARLLVSEHPRWALGWVVYGIANTDKKENWEIAEEALEHAAKLDPKSPEPPRSLAALASLRGDKDEAADLMLKAAMLAPANLELQTIAARILSEVNRWEEAKQRYDVVLDADPRNLKAVTGYGSMLTDQGEYAAAIAVYEEAIAEGEDNILVFNNMVDALVRGAQYERAIEIADQALAKRSDPYILLHKARALSRLGRTAEATKIARKVIDEKQLGGEQLAFPWYEVGVAEAAQGCAKKEVARCTDEGGPACCDHDRAALEAFQTAYEIRPEFKDTVIRLGLAEFAVGKLEDAEATLKTYVDAQGDKVTAEAFGALAVTLYRFGEEPDVKAAVRMYSEARELAPDFDSADRLVKFRQWPPFAIEITQELRKRADAPPEGEGADGEGGCGACTATPASAPRSLPALALGLLLGGFIFWRRRRDA